MKFKVLLKEHFLYLVEPNQFTGIDLMRAVAVIAVVAHHFGEYFPTFAFRSVSNNGYIGVDLFFVISGFLIGRLLLKELLKTNKISFKNFYYRRILRILPLYWFITLATIMGWIFVRGFPVELKYAVKQFCIDILFLHTTIQYPGELSAWGSWSLAVEEWFYFFAPILFFFAFRALRWNLKKFSYVIIFSIGVGVLIRTLSVLAVPVSGNGFDFWMSAARPYCRFDEILIGVLIAVWDLESKIPRQKIAQLLFLLLGAVFIWLGCHIENMASVYSIPILRPFILACGFGLILLNLRFLNCRHPVIQITAKLSYSLYLVHLFFRMLFPETSVFKFPVIVLLTILTSYLLSLLVEYPFIKIYKPVRKIK